MNIFGYNRIIIVGNNGSGKSFLSKELSIITGLPLIHLDVEFWLPNWEKPPKEEWLKKQIELASKEKWIRNFYVFVKGYGISLKHVNVL